MSGYVVVDFPDNGYPGMFAASSHLLPAVDGEIVPCGEVLGEIMDASCLSSEEYAQLLKQVVSVCVWRPSAVR